MIFQRTQYPQWSWSSSRKSIFKECRRKYYYNYYFSHNGWEDEASEEIKLAYRLKNMTGIHLLLGSAVHEAAEHTCKVIKASKNLPDEKTLTDKVRNILNQAWRDSKKKAFWIKQPKKYNMLYEFYYGYGISDDVVEIIKDKMKKAVSNMLKSESINNVLEDGCQIKITEKMDTFELFETSIYAIPDLVFKTSGGKWVVVDWKTGKVHASHSSQINVYCMYLNNKYGIAEEDITGRVEYLITGEKRDVTISKLSFEQTKKEIKESIDEMKKCLADPEKNIPLERKYYPLIKYRKFCRWCNFYEMCREELCEV